MKVYPPLVAVNIVTPDGSYAPHIGHWLEHMQVPHGNIEIKALCNRDVAIAHNATLYRCMAWARERGLEWCLLIDNDVQPICGESDELFTAPFDLTCCKCAQRTGAAAWALPNCFHVTMWIARLTDLERIPQPAFHWITTPDGAKITGCICAFFAMQARGVGLSTGHVGWCTHVPKTGE